MLRTIAGTYYKLKYYSKAASWYSRVLKESGDTTALDLVIQCLYLANDFQGAANEARAAVEADEKAGRTSTEGRLQLLISSQLKLGDNAGQMATLMQLLAHYPQKQYWEMAISKLYHKAGFAERLNLDVLRLRFELGDLKREGDYMEMAQLCLEVGFPAEAKKVIDQGYANGMLGKGNDADRHKRLQAKAAHDAAEDQKALGLGDIDAEKAKGGDAMVNTGYNYVLNGKADKGLPLMDQGLRKGGLKHADDARLHYGVALLHAGQKARAIEEFQMVKGNDGVSDLARLWAVYATR
jgi:tetratricopeptide (TPR) repeat protein